MKNVLKAEQIREAERVAENAGLDEKLLRVNAALAVADDMLDRVQDRLAHTAVFCGTGGNGYDGLGGLPIAPQGRRRDRVSCWRSR